MREITTKDGSKLTPDKLVDFGEEKEYLAYIGDMIYVKGPDGKYDVMPNKK